jgi:competence protein ComEC
MKCPLVSVVSAYAAGLLLAGIFQPPLTILFVLSFVALALALLSKPLRPVLIWPLLALVGWTNLTFHTTVISPDDLRTLVGNTDAIVSVRGVLDETPKIKISERNGEPTEHILAQVHVIELRRGENWQPALGEIIVRTPGALPEHFFAGQAVEISGVLARPPLPLAEGLFDYRDYLQTRGIYYQLKADSVNDWQLHGPVLSRPPLTDRFLNWSKRTLALGLPVEDEPLKLLWAMTLGWRTAFTGDISEPFLRAGTMHLFAIDGLRIALISAMLVALLRVLQISRAWCGFIAIPVIWFYTAATGWESSAIRASVMMTIVLGGWSLKRPANLINSLAAAAFIILLWEPRQLFEAGFQLSFFVVLIIGLLTPPLNNLSDRLLQHDPLVPDELVPRWQRWCISLSHPLARYVSLSFAAWAGSIPLSAKYFHLFSPVSTPANIIAVPLGTLALMSNLGALVCGAWFPWATEMFNHSAWFFMSAMTDVSEWSTKIPGAYFYVPGPSWISILLYYLVLIIILSGWLKTALKRTFGAFILVCVAAIYLWQWERSCGETDLTILPLNGGHAVFVDATGQKNDWLVNCGNANAVESTLTPFLHAQGVNKIRRLILAEGDARNIGGAPLLNDLFDVRELWTSGVQFRSPVYHEVVTEFEKPSSRHQIFEFGEIVDDWQVLWPDATNRFSHADDNALVLCGNFHGTRILLLSDLGRDGQSALLQHTNDLRADIVVTGLPNEGEPLCNALITAVQPRLIIIADSESPATRRAGQELKDRLEQTGIPVIFTRSSGAVKIVAAKSGWRLETMDGQVFNSAASSGQLKHIPPAE